MVKASSQESSVARPAQPANKARWSLPHYLSIIAVPILVWEVWTVTAWLADGPHSITQYRDTNSLNWYLARVYESFAFLVAIVMLVYVVRGCRRDRKILTFDIMFLLCGASMVWLDSGLSFFQPVWLVSSNWLNLNSMCGHMPFVVNPDCGRVPDNLPFTIILCSFGLLAVAVGAGKLVSWARTRWHGISTPQLFALLAVTALVVDLLCEVPFVWSGLWTYTGGPGIPLGRFRYPFVESIAGIAFFMLATVRVFRDDAGRTIFERGLQRFKPKTQKAVAMLAMYGLFQLVGGGLGNLPIVTGPYSPKWEKMPAYVVNGVCDAPGFRGTRYGPCPGSPGYRMPTRQTHLAGDSP